MKPEYQIAISILTILASGGLATLIVHFFGARRDERAFKRQKLEELYNNSRKYCMSLHNYGFRYIPAFSGALSIDKVNDLQLKAAKNASHDAVALEMLASLYFPEIKPALSNIYLIRNTINEPIEDFLINYHKKGAEKNPALIDLMDSALKRLEDAEKQLAEAIVKESNRINKGWWNFW